MNNERPGVQFKSALARLIEQFIEEKRACGYKYATEADSLRRLVLRPKFFDPRWPTICDTSQRGV